MKGIYTTLTAALTLAAMGAQAAPSHSSATDLRLEKELSAFAQAHPAQNQKPTLNTHDWRNQAPVLTGKMGCVDTTSQEIDGRYVMTFDAKNQPCRIYDLSFPTIATIFGMQTVSKLPVQQFTADDYLNWMHGDYDKVYQGIKSFRSSFKAGQAGWMSGVEFKDASLTRLRGIVGTSPAGLPNSFAASDLKTASDFAFSDDERQELLQAVQDMQLTAGFAADAGAWARMVENPNEVLEHIRFNWNDLEKAYDVIMDGDFFPIVGPVALVDFGTPYKPAMQGMARSLVQSAILRLVGGVENVTNNRILTVALKDTFEFIEGIYTYQMNMMEMSLQNTMAQAGEEAPLSVNASRGIDLLFSTRTGFFTDYILAIAQGQTFDWTKIEFKGHQARYKADKAREVSMDQRNSELALKGGCTTTPMATYFALCTKNGKADGVYSLLSDTSVLFWSFGAPRVFNPGFPSEVLLKRATSRILETGLRIVRLPILDFLTDILADELKSYAMSGAYDEAFLHSNLLYAKHTHGGLDADSAQMLKWMYLQNINPFMPKTEASETSTENTNRGHAPASVGMGR